ncbi:DUF2239 family protein [Parasphingopyxis marina]|uniref:DUF2239 family protein n=1 Tax=Parasphingopyxis marina TaxID=2761622 RepID=A0A842HVX5_9SPHN|nr:DUF2239 family protein [Parasphingopyxis marina]MBC2776577.1 DUF2239 family protein [Parasphingopyxis marina]
MTMTASTPCTGFSGMRRIASGPLAEVALAIRAAQAAGGADPLLVFDDATGRVVDLDLRGSESDVLARLATPDGGSEAPELAKPRGRGRPKLGVVGREVTLLPRHWDWLESQSGSASQIVRRLIDEARKAERSGRAAAKARAERAYRAMTSLGGDLPGYEEAVRALFAGDAAALAERMKDWPGDVAAYALRLAAPESDEEETP